MKQITEKQKRFADYYISSLNATQSYLKVYKVKNDRVASVNASQLLANPNVKAYVKNELEQLSKERVMTRDEILERHTSIARGELTEEVIVPLYKKYERVRKQASIKDMQKSMEHISKLRGDYEAEKKDVTITDVTYSYEWGEDE